MTYDLPEFLDVSKGAPSHDEIGVGIFLGSPPESDEK
jgi:hypothetical protein